MTIKEEMEKRIKRERKRIKYVDFDHVEFGTDLTVLEARTRERLLTTRQMDAFVFWLDIEEGLKTLTKRQRGCFKAYFIEGYGEDEIAEKTGLSQPVVHRHIETALMKMKCFLGRDYQNTRM